MYRIRVHVCAQQCTLPPTEPLFTVRRAKYTYTRLVSLSAHLPQRKIKNRGGLWPNWLCFHAGGIMINGTKSLRAQSKFRFGKTCTSITTIGKKREICSCRDSSNLEEAEEKMFENTAVAWRK